MTQLDDLLAEMHIECGVLASSKKKALEALSSLLAGTAGGTDEVTIFDALIARERLGSTGLGFGVAIPHGRLAGIERTVGGLLVLGSGVDFDAPDGAPVDVLFGLLVPEACNDEHLAILAGLAQLFSDEQLRERLRSCGDADSLRATLRDWRPAPARSA